MIRFSVARARSSAVERPAHNRLVPGSNPGGPTIRCAIRSLRPHKLSD